VADNIKMDLKYIVREFDLLAPGSRLSALFYISLYFAKAY